MDSAGAGTDAIVLTGCGWVTPFAVGSIEEVLAAACDAPPRPPLDQLYWAIPDLTVERYAHLSKELKSDTGAWVTATAFERARREAGLDVESLAPERVGMALGCALAGQLGMIQFANEVRQQSARFVSPIHFPQTVGNYVAGALARSYDIRGPNTTLAGGCASGVDAIVEGCRLLRAEEADVIFAGGFDCLSDALAVGLIEAGLARRPDRAASADDESPCLRPSEGACLFVLERRGDAQRRGAGVLAEVTGSGHLAAGDALTRGVKGGPVTPPVIGPAEVARGDIVVSVAGLHRPDAVCIEHWIGRCFAALGAAAVAAAIAAARGLEVPVLSPGAAGGASVRRVVGPREGTPGKEEPGTVKATVLADADGAEVSTLELTAATHS